MKIAVSIILYVFLSTISLNLSPIYKIPFSAKVLLSDHLGNTYGIDNFIIKKYNINGIETANYSDSYLGKIYYADVTDPYRILLFYKDFNQIVFLDKNLSPILSPVNLNDFDLAMPAIACVSSNGGFWVYDEQTSQIKHYDKNMEITTESIAVNKIIETKSLPDIMIEKNNFIFIHFPDYGLVIFDKYGAFYKSIKQKEMSSIQVQGKSIVYLNNNNIIKYNFELLKTDTLDFQIKKKIQNFRIENNVVFIQATDTLFGFSYK
ncbi:MAG: hypothetical protein Kow0068_11540 [Marinilabiliales bacterium]